MSRPKYFYEVDAHDTVAHADGGRCLTVQQAHPLGGGRSDALVFLNRDNAKALAAVLNQWLEESADDAN